MLFSLSLVIFGRTVKLARFQAHAERLVEQLQLVVDAGVAEAIGEPLSFILPHIRNRDARGFPTAEHFAQRLQAALGIL